MTHISDDNISVELFEEVLTLYEEDIKQKSVENFKEFVLDMLPPNVLEEVERTVGGESFLDDIWNEKYDITVEDDNDNFEYVGFRERICEVCERKVNLTAHHLIPRETHKTMLKRGISKETLNITIPICRLCHSTIHRFFSNDELANTYNTLEKLLEDEKFFKYAKWASALSDKRYSGAVKR